MCEMRVRNRSRSNCFILLKVIVLRILLDLRHVIEFTDVMFQGNYTVQLWLGLIGGLLTQFYTHISLRDSVKCCGNSWILS